MTTEVKINSFSTQFDYLLFFLVLIVWIHKQLQHSETGEILRRDKAEEKKKCINLPFLEQQPFQNIQQQSKALMPEALHPAGTTNVKSISQQRKTDNWQ